MLAEIAAIQTAVLLFFATLERLMPARRLPKSRHFYAWWSGLGLIGLAWLKLMLAWWLAADIAPMLDLSGLHPVAAGCLLYIPYSLGNYWWHRAKHRVPWLWRVLHKLHHAPSHMESFVAFFRHPAEMLANTLYIVVLGKLIFGASAEALAVTLAIEGCLETFHHSNIHLPASWRWVGYLIQTPVMHLVHHEKGLHRFNYSPFLWDTLFGTAVIPDYWDRRLGFSDDDLTGVFWATRRRHGQPTAQPQGTGRCSAPRHD